MKFILILIATIFASDGESVSMTTAEFDDEAACKAAAIKADQAFKDVSSSRAKRFRAACVPKGSTS